MPVPIVKFDKRSMMHKKAGNWEKKELKRLKNKRECWSGFGAGKKKSPNQVWGFFEYGGETQDRTGDTRIFNPLLYLLSYHADAVY